jgi:hypothetical protein
MPSSRERLQGNSKILEEGWIRAKLVTVHVGVRVPISGRIMMLWKLQFLFFKTS